MFKVLMAKMQANNLLEKKGKMKIVKQNKEGKGSQYSSELFAVKINSNFYETSGLGISSRKYFYIDDDGKIKTKLKSLAGSVFHEFCHGLHDVSGTAIPTKKNIICLKGSDLVQVWDYEELRTITCFEHDPICDHCFDFCKSILKNESFHPRYSHGGHRGEGEPTTDDLQKYYKLLPASQKFMDGQRECVL
jgi:hypothetical protein